MDLELSDNHFKMKAKGPRNHQYSKSKELSHTQKDSEEIKVTVNRKRRFFFLFFYQDLSLKNLIMVLTLSFINQLTYIMIKCVHNKSSSRSPTN